MDNILKKIAFVDGENVGYLSNYSSLSLDYKEIHYFLGATQRLPPELLQKHQNIKIIKINKTAKNNLDFHLAMYLGRLHEKLSNDFVFEVISNDTGFDGIVSFINKNWNRKCVRNGATCLRNSTLSKIHNHFHGVTDGFGLPKSINALHNYLLAKSLSTADNVYDHISILFDEYGLYLDFEDRIRYDRFNYVRKKKLSVNQL